MLGTIIASAAAGLMSGKNTGSGQGQVQRQAYNPLGISGNFEQTPQLNTDRYAALPSGYRAPTRYAPSMAGQPVANALPPSGIATGIPPPPTITPRQSRLQPNQGNALDPNSYLPEEARRAYAANVAPPEGRDRLSTFYNKDMTAAFSPDNGYQASSPVPNDALYSLGWSLGRLF